VHYPSAQLLKFEFIRTVHSDVASQRFADLDPLFLSVLEKFDADASLNSSPRCSLRTGLPAGVLFPKKSLRRAAKYTGQQRTLLQRCTWNEASGIVGKKNGSLFLTCYAGGALAPWSNPSCKVQARFVEYNVETILRNYNTSDSIQTCIHSQFQPSISGICMERCSLLAGSWPYLLSICDICSDVGCLCC
jgi:hypothetical protein